MPTLHWIGKDKVINHHQDVPYRILEKQYTYKDGQESDAPSENKIIHGDNLEALKSLLPEYEGKVKCIYIDPPYNTGNEGWVYNDNVNDPKLKKWLGQVVGKESEDLSRHDKWLCMMYPRLKLLHKLLAEDGAIFISIDDNEQANLKLICDEIFGGRNFVTDLVWRHSDNSNNNTLKFSEDYNHTLIYSKKDDWKPNFLNDVDKRKHFKNPDNDPKGPWFDGNPVNNPGLRVNLQYNIETPSGKIIKHPPNGWRWSKETIAEKLSTGELRFSPDEKRLIRRTYLNESEGLPPSNLWIDLEKTSHTRRAKYDLKSIFPEVATTSLFPTPKATKFIENILKIATLQDSIILDSFAGSGTTAHAVLNLNKEDGGNRKFILIEMEDYADTITAERVKRVITGYGEEKKAVEGTGGDFSYYVLGKPVFLDNEMLNEEIGKEKIEEYVWFSETKLPYQAQQENYLLGTKDQTAYYFYYDPNSITTLDESFLRTLKTKASQYIIYADNCLLTKELMQKYNIIFKKIPRDITRF
ncbi:site-specific DNA-methyltransferase [Kaistella carnis]|uniref:site-specific DNA-methyltransferase (adenine-specific) n=1 Tax=Kaistella carnis TaxID=1241979 RepID=A0A3G8XTV6_9FLAO|nr:site-specific DNA-methyltransferase [Kaistella carnis]AZI33644.1 site-specific DNA-methyltransferase [Kaistella carnis]